MKTQAGARPSGKRFMKLQGEHIVQFHKSSFFSV